MPDKGDAQFVRRLKERDPSAMDEMVDRFSNKIFNLAIGLLKNQEDASDVVQDTLLQVFEKIETFRGDSQLSSWIYRIAINFAYMKIRKNKRNEYIPIEENMPQFQKSGMHARPVNSWAEKADVALERKETRELLRTNISKLAEKYRTVLVLRDIEGFSTEEVAEITGMTIPAVKSRLHRARLFLREKLADYYRG